MVQTYLREARDLVTSMRDKIRRILDIITGAKQMPTRANGTQVPTMEEFEALTARVVQLENNDELQDNRLDELEGNNGGGEVPVPPVEYDVIVEKPSADGNNTTEINNAIKQAAAMGGERTVYIDAGDYPHDGIIELTGGITLCGAGSSTVIRSTNQNGDGWPTLCIHMTGEAPTLRNLKITTDWNGDRQGTPYAQAVWVDRANRFYISGVHVVGAGAGGLYCETSTNGIVEDNEVQDTLADGIGIGYSGSSFNIARRNNVHNTGDDNISICSYKSYDQSTGNTIEDNICDGSWFARGIVDLGGKDTIIRRNTVRGAKAAGIFTIRDDLCDTYECTNCLIEDNLVDGCCDPSSGYVANYQICQDTKNVSVINNISMNPKREHYSVGANCTGHFEGNEPPPGADVQAMKQSHNIDPKRFMRPAPKLPPKPKER